LAYETLELIRDGAIATVRLTGAEKLNIMTPAFWTEMVEVFAEIEADSAIRAVIIASGGRHFTAGLDLATALADLSTQREDPARTREQLRRKILRMQDTFSVIDRCKAPVIAVIQGGCIGGGVDLATACDLRIGTADSFFQVQEINIGIVADVGTLQRLPHLLPNGIVRELAYTGRRMGAEEAARYGLLNRVEANHEAALAAAKALAAEIALKSPLAITGTKEVINHARDVSVSESLNYVATWNAGMLVGQDLQAAVGAVMTKSQAQFKDLYG
jgi:enoyl-CoA hydratase